MCRARESADATISLEDGISTFDDISFCGNFFASIKDIISAAHSIHSTLQLNPFRNIACSMTHTVIRVNMDSNEWRCPLSYTVNCLSTLVDCILVHKCLIDRLNSLL